MNFVYCLIVLFTLFVGWFVSDFMFATIVGGALLLMAVVARRIYVAARDRPRPVKYL
jgi:hypothetical protein